jgi:hypothetical protein
MDHADRSEMLKFKAAIGHQVSYHIFSVHKEEDKQRKLECYQSFGAEKVVHSVVG